MPSTCVLFTIVLSLSTPKTQKRVQLKFFYLLLLWLLSNENSAREIFYRGAMERQERKLSPSSNIGVDLTGRGQLDNSLDRDAVESNRLGQWRSRLASSDCIGETQLHLRRWKVFGEAGRRIIYQSYPRIGFE